MNKIKTDENYFDRMIDLVKIGKRVGESHYYVLGKHFCGQFRLTFSSLRK